MKKREKKDGKIVLAFVIALCDCGCGGRCGREACRCNERDENRNGGEDVEDGGEE